MPPYRMNYFYGWAISFQNFGELPTNNWFINIIAEHELKVYTRAFYLI